MTCFGGAVLYRNNGNGTFTDATREAGLTADNGWATGASFGDYDSDGSSDLFVASQNDLRLHFGLGKQLRADKVEVTWSSGAKETVTNLAADHAYVIQEGKGVVATRPVAAIPPFTP